MSEFPLNEPQPFGVLEAIDAAVAAGLPAPVVRSEATRNVYIFTPDLTPAQITILQGVVADLTGAKRTLHLELSLDEYRAIKADLATLRTFVGIANPTAAQTANAVKAMIRSLRALLHDA